MFEEVLEAESYIDIVKLADMSQYGVPHAHRGAVWKYLLKISAEDRGSEAAMARSRKVEYAEMDKTDTDCSRLIAKAIKRYIKNIYKKKNSIQNHFH